MGKVLQLYQQHCEPDCDQTACKSSMPWALLETKETKLFKAAVTNKLKT